MDGESNTANSGSNAAANVPAMRRAVGQQSAKQRVKLTAYTLLLFGLPAGYFNVYVLCGACGLAFAAWFVGTLMVDHGESTLQS